MVFDSETQRQNLLRLLDRVQITGAEAEILVELKVAIRAAAIQPPVVQGTRVQAPQPAENRVPNP